MNWKENVVLSGRLLGAAIIVVGILLAAMTAIDLDAYQAYGDHARLRYFIREALTYLWSGGLVLVVAELVARVGGEDAAPWPVDWNIVDLVRALGAAIVVGGLLVSIWDVWSFNAFGEDSLALVSRAPRTAYDSFRYVLRDMLQSYLWQGGLLILLAALADRLGPDSGNAMAEADRLIDGAEAEG